MNNVKAVLVGTLLLMNLMSLCMVEGVTTKAPGTPKTNLAAPCFAAAPLLLAFALMAVHFLRAR